MPTGDIQLPKSLMSIKDFAAKIKAQYPVTKDVPDNTLVKTLLDKYPQFKDKVENPLSGDAEAKTAQDKAQAKSEYGSRFVNGMKSIIPSISDIPSNINRSIDPLNPKYADDRSISQKVSDLGEPESLGAMTSGIALGAIGDSAEPIGKAAEWAGKGIERAGDSPYMRHLGGYSAMGELMHGSPVKAAGLAATPPALTYGGKAMQYLGKRLQTPPTPEPAPTFDYPSRAIKNPPSIPSAPVDVPNMSPVDPRISNITPEASTTPSPLNTAFDPSKLVSPSDLRQSELLSKFGGRQASNVPQDLSASGAVSGNTTAPALPIDQATSKVKPGLGITAAEPQNPAVSGVDPATHSITINGKTYPLDNNGNPIGLNAPSTFLQPKTPGAGFSIYPNFFKG